MDNAEICNYHLTEINKKKNRALCDIMFNRQIHLHQNMKNTISTVLLETSQITVGSSCFKDLCTTIIAFITIC